MKRHRSSFTLIEMLVTVLVIFIMLGIIFRLVPVISDAAAKARCVAELQQIRNALNEYHTEYGIYPPVDFTEYEYEHSVYGYQTPFFKDIFLPAHSNPAAADFFADVRERMPTNSPGTNWFLGYRYGLVSHLYPRKVAGGQQVHWYDADTERDKAAKKRWEHFIKDVGPDSCDNKPHPTPSNLGALAPYTNKVQTLKDPWGASYKYVCKPPYVRFKLWSVGRDGADGTPDDIDSAQEQ